MRERKRDIPHEGVQISGANVLHLLRCGNDCPRLKLQVGKVPFPSGGSN